MHAGPMRVFISRADDPDLGFQVGSVKFAAEPVRAGSTGLGCAFEAHFGLFGSLRSSADWYTSFVTATRLLQVRHGQTEI